jgi:hypothetical protein
MLDFLVVISFLELLVVVRLLTSITHFPCDVYLKVLSGLRMFFLLIKFRMVLQIQISCEMLRDETIGHRSHIRSLVPVFRLFPRGEKYQST